MVNYLKMLLSVAVNVTRNACINMQKEKGGNDAGVFMFNMLCSVFSCVTLLILSGGGKPSGYSIMMAFVMGTVIVVSFYNSVTAFASGSMAYTVLFGSCGMIIPTVFGTLFYKETVSVAQVIGFLIMPVGFFLGANPRKDERVTVKWLIHAILYFVFAGLVGVVQKIYINSDYSSENGIFLTLTFAFSACISGMIYMYKQAETGEKVSVLDRGNLSAAVVGLCDGMQHKINLILSGIIPSMIFFPVVNGGAILGATLVSVAVFKEHLNRKQIAGIIVCAVAIMLMCNITDNIM